MFFEYYTKPESSVSAFCNLLFRTGDWGLMDEDGFVCFVDRMQDSIRCPEENGHEVRR